MKRQREVVADARTNYLLHHTMKNHSTAASLLRTHRPAGIFIVTALLLSLGCFLAGLIRPFTAVTKLWLFENQISVVAGLVTLWKASEIFLFLILLVFTVLFPFVKINALLTLWLRRGLTHAQAQKLFKFVAELGKWSMLDVFVVAILVLTIKSGGLASVKVQDGFFLFFVSVMLTQCASFATGRIVSRLLD